MPSSPYETARQHAQALEPADQLRLIGELISRLGAELTTAPRSLLDLEGLGEEVWKGVDVEEYLRKERSSWSG
jgi:hypothetical protein